MPAAPPRSVILPLVSERPLTRPFAGQAVAGFQALGRFSDFGSGGRVDAFVGRHLREWTQAANYVMEDLRPYEAGQIASYGPYGGEIRRRSKQRIVPERLVKSHLPGRRPKPRSTEQILVIVSGMAGQRIGS